MPGASDAKQIINAGAAARVKTIPGGAEMAARCRAINRCIEAGGLSVEHIRRLAKIELDLMKDLRAGRIDESARTLVNRALEKQDEVLGEMLLEED